MTSTKNNKNRALFCKDLNLNILDVSVKSLMRACITHHHLCECECNGCTREKYSFESWKEYDEARIEQQKWIEQRLKATEKNIKKLTEKLNLFVRFEGDPRGPTVKLSRNPISEDSCTDHTAADVWNWK